MLIKDDIYIYITQIILHMTIITIKTSQREIKLAPKSLSCVELTKNKSPKKEKFQN